jgi:nucleotide-binding universal stress UspA family protein
MSIDKILAGIDFAKDTDSVLAYASFFAKSFSASLTLLHVIDYLMTPPSYLVPYIEEEKREAGEKLETLKKQLADTGLNAGAWVVIGRLREIFELAAKQMASGLVVLCPTDFSEISGRALSVAK